MDLSLRRVPILLQFLNVVFLSFPPHYFFHALLSVFTSSSSLVPSHLVYKDGSQGDGAKVIGLMGLEVIR